jgi:hypothetical protein
MTKNFVVTLSCKARITGGASCWVFCDVLVTYVRRITQTDSGIRGRSWSLKMGGINERKSPQSNVRVYGKGSWGARRGPCNRATVYCGPLWLWIRITWQILVNPVPSAPTKSTFQRSLYVPPGLAFNGSTFCPHSVFMCFVWISEQTAIISLYSINWLTNSPMTVYHGCTHIFSVTIGKPHVSLHTHHEQVFL